MIPYEVKVKPKMDYNIDSLMKYEPGFHFLFFLSVLLCIYLMDDPET